MTDDTLQQAIGLVKAGKYNEARGLLYHLVKTDPHNEMAWLWLSETMSDAQRLPTLEQALKFNPDSQKLQHALDRLRAKHREESAGPSALSAVESKTQPLPQKPTSAVDRSNIQTAPLTFLPDEPSLDSPPPAKPAPPPTKPTPVPTSPADRSQIQTAPLPPPSDRIDRSLIRTARLEMPPEGLPPESPPSGKPPAATPAPVSSSKVDRSNIQTAPLAYVPDESEKDIPPAAKPVDVSKEPEKKLPPAAIPAAVPKESEKELPPAALLALVPIKSKDELSPAAIPAAASQAPEKELPPAATPAAIPEEPRKELPPTLVSAAVAAAVVPPAKLEKPSAQKTPPPPERAARSILRDTHLDQVTEVPHQTGPLPVPPPAAAPTPAKPAAETAVAPAVAMKQMDALLTEPHPSPDPVLKSPAGSGPPKPPAPPLKEKTITPEEKPRRRLSGLEIALIVIAVLLVLGIAGFMLWDFFGPQPESPTVVEPPLPLPTQPTETLADTNTPEVPLSPVPPPTLRPTFTPLVSPTPTLNPDSPSILFFASTSCAVNQVSANGGAALLLANAVPANCLAPEFSPDGLKFAYRVQDAKTKSINSIYVANVDGSAQKAVVDKSASPVWEVDWAPDNTWLSYSSMVGSNDANPVIGIYLVRADGSGQIQVTNDQTASIMTDNSNSVSWSPDGQWLAFYSDNRPYIVKPDGTGLKQLSGDAGLSVIAWSPDSRQIAYYSSDLNNPGIIVVGIDGKQSFVKNKDLKVPVSGDTLIWTPDGKQFVAYDVAQKALVTVSRDGTQIKTLAPVSGIPTRLAWSPDGSQLAYLELPQQDSPSGVLKIVNADGTDLKTLITSAANAPLRWKTPVNSTQSVTPAPTIKVPAATNTPSPTP